jgi:hypothetical protein
LGLRIAYKNAAIKIVVAETAIVESTMGINAGKHHIHTLSMHTKKSEQDFSAYVEEKREFTRAREEGRAERRTVGQLHYMQLIF